MAEIGDGFWSYVDRLVAESALAVERPGGATDADEPDRPYPASYGYLQGTRSMDGEGVDVWVGSAGPGRAQAMLCTVDLAKRDSEVKILMGCSEDEMRAIVTFMNYGLLRCLLVRRES